MSRRKTEQLIGSRNFGRLFVLSAPAGTGKTTLINMLKNEFPEVIQSISFTTREKRKGEKDGVDYHFISKEEFREKLEEGDFLESAKVYENYYGTDRQWVETQLNKGKHVFLVIDTQGAQLIKEQCLATSIFLFPPSMAELKERLTKRNTEKYKDRKERLEWSRGELEKAVQYDYHIVNDDLDIAYEVLKSIVIAEDHKNE